MRKKNKKALSRRERPSDFSRRMRAWAGFSRWIGTSCLARGEKSQESRILAHGAPFSDFPAFQFFGFLILIAISLLMMPFIAFSGNKKIPVVIDGDEISYLQAEGKIVARGNVIMKYKGDELFCEEADYDANSNIAYMKGDIKIVKDRTVLYGQDIIYDFNTSNAQIVNIRIEDPPIYGKAEKGNKVLEEKYILSKGYITTCDLTKPHYRLTAKKIIVYPGDKVIARNMILKVGNIPIFYFPYLSQSLEDKTFPVDIVPGKSSEWGGYFLTCWRHRFNNENQSRVHLDWYEKRGWGTGLTHKIESEKLGRALIKYYRIKDTLYGVDKKDELFDRHPDRESINSKYLEDDRYNAQFSYSWDPQPNLSIRSEFHKLSDKFFMEDFFEREYDVEPHPLSYTLINYSLTGSSLSLLAQKRANRFWAETEYLPQIEYDFYRQNLGSSKFYFKSGNKLSNLAYKRADSNSDLDDSAARLYSHNVLSYADKIKWLSIAPYIGSYTAFYSRNKAGDDNISRVAFESGVTLNTRVYKVFNADWNLFGEEVSMMRHILGPEIKYSYIHAPTVSNGNIYQFDDLDSLAREEKIIFTLENKLQARNKQRTWDFIYFSPSVEYRINEEGKGSYFDNIKADFEIYPKKGLSLTADTIYDIQTRRISEFNAGLTIKGMIDVLEGGEEIEKEKYSFSYGQRYTRQDSTQGTLNFSYQITPKVKIENYLRCEYNTGDLHEQQYRIRTDLHCWWMDFGVTLKKRDEGSKDTSFWIVFTLKAFPDISVDFDHNYEGSKGSY